MGISDDFSDGIKGKSKNCPINCFQNVFIFYKKTPKRLINRGFGSFLILFPMYVPKRKNQSSFCAIISQKSQKNECNFDLKQHKIGQNHMNST